MEATKLSKAKETETRTTTASGGGQQQQQPQQQQAIDDGGVFRAHVPSSENPGLYVIEQVTEGPKRTKLVVLHSKQTIAGI
mgnify:CR=1 FL=1